MGRPGRCGSPTAGEPRRVACRVPRADRRAGWHRSAPAGPPAVPARHPAVAASARGWAAPAGAGDERRGQAIARGWPASVWRGRRPPCLRGWNRYTERPTHRRSGNDRFRGLARLCLASARAAAPGERTRQSDAARRVAAAGGLHSDRKCPPPPGGPRGGPGGGGDRHSAPRTMRRALVLLVAALTAGELGAHALRPPGRASLVTARVRSAVPAGIDQFTGSAFLGQGALAMGRVELSFSYLQGTLNHDGGSAGGRDLVEGTVLLGVRSE